MTDPFDVPRMSRALLGDQMSTIRRELGEGVEQAALAKLTPADREALSGSLGWCDVGLAMRYKDAVGAQVGKDSLTFQRWIVRLGVERTVTGLWRRMLVQVWDEAVVKRVPIIYQRTFDKGAMTASFEGKGAASMAVTGWPRMPEYDIVGLQVGIETILTLTGRENTTAQPTRTTDGVAFRVRWTAR